MSTGQRPAEPPPSPAYLAGLLSYLVPGLGQITQGRTGKGILFLVMLLGMFFLGQAMGDWRNVYMPPPEGNDANPIRKPLASIYNRWHFAGQFWIGIAAWPAIWQFYDMPVPTKEKQVATKKNGAWATITNVNANQGTISLRMNGEAKTFKANDIQFFDSSGRPAALDAFTAGNEVWVIEADGRLKEVYQSKDYSFWHNYQRAPKSWEEEREINAFLSNSDKTPDLGWVYTVVAGMLNILVIYDAVMGPAFVAAPRAKEQPGKEAAGEPAARDSAAREGAAS